MACDRSITEAGNGAGAVSQATGSRVRYVEPAPLAEVILDQLKYLLAHKRKSCSAGCDDCVRLKQVKGLLLLPFRTTANGKLSTKGCRV